MRVNYDLFGEDIDFHDAIDSIRFDDFEGVDNVEDVLSCNLGWYNYSTITFDYEDKRYSIEYKEHTSDNVCDLEYLTETFVCLGDVEDMKRQISGEDLARIESNYERQLESMNQKLSKHKQALSSLDSLSSKNLKRLGNMLIEVHEESQDKSQPDMGMNDVGKFLKCLAEMK